MSANSKSCVGLSIAVESFGLVQSIWSHLTFADVARKDGSCKNCRYTKSQVNCLSRHEIILDHAVCVSLVVTMIVTRTTVQ